MGAAFSCNAPRARFEGAGENSVSQFHLILLIHAHQPVGNFEDVLECAYVRCYLPFVQALREHPGIRLGLHYSGVLLEWLERRRPEFFNLLGELVEGHQVELVGGGFYEPILVAIPEADRQEQIRRLADFLKTRWGVAPKGAWLTERVWEPQLASTLARAGVEYTLADDAHFLASGMEPEQLYGYYVTEDLGATLKVIPGLKALRYLIPFRSVEENIAFLRAAAEKHPGGFAAMGDDCEKFGLWPGTHDHCYTQGWLEKFFAALEAQSDWLALTTPGDYLAAHPALGRAYLPTASYPEMAEWALPTPARQRFHAMQREFGSHPEAERFLRGSFWRSFLSKYGEANLLHKKMLLVSEKIQRLARHGAAGHPEAQKAREHLLRAQCNDAYWHGIFGGLYAPHLRSAMWRELVRAEALADAALQGQNRFAELRCFDFDADGQEELYWVSESGAALVKPSDGGTVALLDYRPAAASLVSSLQRRREAYHERLAQADSKGNAKAVSIHEQVRTKETGLQRHLRYDRWPRHLFRLLLFPPGKTLSDYIALQLEECPAFAGDAFQVRSGQVGSVVLAKEGFFPGSEAGTNPMRAEKTFSFAREGSELQVSCEVALLPAGRNPLALQAGLEVILNFLAPEAADRYFEYGGERHPLLWSAAVPASALRIVDEWQNVAVCLEAPEAQQFWVAPIETVSESEEGFERIYQGSQILPVWPLVLQPGEQWTGRVSLLVSSARPEKQPG